MKKILFASGIGVPNKGRPERWLFVTKLYLQLASSLHDLGFESFVICNPSAAPENRGNYHFEICESHTDLDKIVEKVKPDFCFIWNGNSVWDKLSIASFEKYNSRVIFSELGWFPQKGTIYFNEYGTNASACFDLNKFVDLSFKDRVFLMYRKIKYRRIKGAKYFGFWEGKIKNKGRGSKLIFVPLQDEEDTNITVFSPYLTMNEFVNDLLKMYPDVSFIVRPHPRSRKKFSIDSSRVVIDSGGSYINTIDQSDYVIGINSTMLLESCLLGKPTISYGKHMMSGTKIMTEASKGEVVNLSKISQQCSFREKALFYLLKKIQMPQKSLRKSSKVKRSTIFQILSS